MTAANLTYDALKSEYRHLFQSASINPSAIHAVEAMARAIYAHRDRYIPVAEHFKCPWPLIGVIHALEGELDFSTHLHNGDPLTHRTVLEPIGHPRALPASGHFPYTWEESAIDAITIKGWGSILHWTLEMALYRLELYNGMGYRTYHPTVLSPYLWSMTNKYTRGKYIADHKFSTSAVSKQVGAVALLLALAEIDSALALDKMLPFDDASDDTDGEHEDTVRFVQTRLRDLGYTEVGRIDGLMGRNTQGAILTFRHENKLPLDPKIDDALLTALARAGKRQIGEARASATAKDLKADHPGLAASMQSKTISAVTGGLGTAYVAINGIVSNLDGATSFLAPVKNLLGEIPTSVWAIMVVGAAVAIYLNAQKTEDKIVDSYREGVLK